MPNQRRSFCGLNGLPNGNKGGLLGIILEAEKQAPSPTGSKRISPAQALNPQIPSKHTETHPWAQKISFVLKTEPGAFKKDFMWRVLILHHLSQGLCGLQAFLSPLS